MCGVSYLLMKEIANKIPLDFWPKSATKYTSGSTVEDQ